MADRPNVLVITADHWPGSLFASSGRNILTPTLDTFAQAGRTFTRAYAECPVCIPSRRSLMTGLSPKGHGDREFKPDEPMPNSPTLAHVFREHGYQTCAVGKLHVYPPRDRIGFDNVRLLEEGRPQLGSVDDYEIFLTESGFAGQQYTHGMSNNDYQWRPWHLSEFYHPTSWTAREMAKEIKRRDPTRPALWYMSFTSPHPPLIPPWPYIELYRDRTIDPPLKDTWNCSDQQLPFALQMVANQWPIVEDDVAEIRRAFYALCTHIDHQIRLVIGTLREEGLLDNTIILFTSDHGDMLGDHGLWAKRLFYESSARIPMIIAGPAEDDRLPAGSTDNRIVAMRDIMPTLLDLAGLPTPDAVEGFSMIREARRDYLYGEYGSGADATRMIVEDRYKLIYYPAGNRCQLFDLSMDSSESNDLSTSSEHANVRQRLEALLRIEMYGSDHQWIRGESLVGTEPPSSLPARDRGLKGVRGLQFPAPPLDPEPGKVVGAPPL